MAGIPLAWNPSPRKIYLFWKSIDKRGPDDCWPCKNERCGRHPMSRLCGWYTSTYRIVFVLDLLSKGKSIPADFDSMKVCHSCDDSWCCNPAHLWLGTQKDNLDDMRAKGREGDCRNFGELHGRCVVSDAEVEEIIDLYATGNWSQRALAEKFNIGKSQIGRIVRGGSRIIADREMSELESVDIAAMRKRLTDGAAWAKKGGRHFKKLDDSQVRQVLFLYRGGAPQQAIADFFQVHRGSIDQIIRNEAYTHIDRNKEYGGSIDCLMDMLDVGKIRKKDSNRKRSEAMKGRKFSDEHKAKLSLAAKHRRLH